MKKYILITGVAGNIGSYLALALLKNNYLVIGVDNFLTGTKDKLPHKSYKNFKFIFGDINNKSKISSIFKSYKINFVFILRQSLELKKNSTISFKSNGRYK